MPASLPADVQVSGEGILRRQVIQQGDGQLWKLFLDEPQWHSYRFMLRARLASESSGRVMIPIVIPQQVAEVRQFLLVLNATENELSIRGAEQQKTVSGDTFGKWFSDPITKSVAGAFQIGDSAGDILVQPVAVGPESADQIVALERHGASVAPRSPMD